MRANALWLRITGPARKFDVAHHAIVAEMSGYWEVIDRADGG
jgi:hypothetical protein